MLAKYFAILVVLSFAWAQDEPPKCITTFIAQNPKLCPAPDGWAWVLLTPNNPTCGSNKCDLPKKACTVSLKDGKPLCCQEVPADCLAAFLEENPDLATTTAATTEEKTTILEETVESTTVTVQEEAEVETTVATETSAEKVTTAAPDSTSSCDNSNELCCYWASIGECEKNPFWMRPNCQNACGTCGCHVKDAANCEVDLTATSCIGGQATDTETQTDAPPAPPADDSETATTTEAAVVSTVCLDTDEVQCPLWKANGECDVNPFWMKVHCAKSCGTCDITIDDINTPKPPSDDCKNLDPLCQFWSELDTNECTTNAVWMSKNCQLSCGLC